MGLVQVIRLAVRDRTDAHTTGRRRRHELPVADVNAGVADSSARRLVEDEVTGLEALPLPDALETVFLRQPELLDRRMGKRCSVIQESPAREPRAVVAAGRSAAVAIGSAGLSECPLADVTALGEGAVLRVGGRR